MSVTTANEQERINALRRYQILDTPPDGAFDRITSLAAKLLNTPIAITSLVDTDRIWFKSHYGLDIQEIERAPGLCSSAILNNIPYVISDASIDPRSLSNPLVAGEFGLRFYAGVPLTTHDNHSLGVLCVIDFEPRIITEQELEILKNLAQVVMDEIELRLASRHIDKLSKENANLLGVLSQEIRNPMNGIMGIASLLLSSELTEEEQIENIEIIEQSGKSLLNLVDHILDYSRIGLGKMELSVQPFDIRFCVSQIMEKFHAEIDNKNVILNTEIDAVIPVVIIGDEHKIQQVLNNLVGNAIKFTNNGEIQVLVQLLSIEHHAQYANISFTVRDTGIGIPNNLIPHLFDSFTRASGELSAGTGLGLSLCKQLIELMGGQIRLEESTSSGSTITFDLRLPFET